MKILSTLLCFITTALCAAEPAKLPVAVEHDARLQSNGKG